MEQIYTIVINEAFEKSAEEKCSCPFCRIHDKFEKDEIDLILGASMMEPNVRIKTNALGFCEKHYSKMLKAGKKLPLALLLESHFAEVAENVKTNRLFPSKSAKGSANYISKLSQTCYVCGRIRSNFEQRIQKSFRKAKVLLFASLLGYDQSGVCGNEIRRTPFFPELCQKHRRKISR